MVTTASGNYLVYFHPLTIMSNVFMRIGTYPLIFIGMVYNIMYHLQTLIKIQKLRKGFSHKPTKRNVSTTSYTLQVTLILLIWINVTLNGQLIKEGSLDLYLHIYKRIQTLNSNKCHIFPILITFRWSVISLHTTLIGWLASSTVLILLKNFFKQSLNKKWWNPQSLNFGRQSLKTK